MIENQKLLSFFTYALIKKEEEISDSISRGLRPLAENELTADILDDGEKSEILIRTQIDATILEHKRRILDEVRLALQRIKGGKFGECANCGEGISILRLTAIPWALTCVDCAEQEELNQF